jgi:hypothetical protein
MGVRWFDGDQNVLVIRALDTSRVRRPGMTTRRSNLDEGETITIHGVRVTSPQRTAFELLRTHHFRMPSLLSMPCCMPAS